MDNAASFTPLAAELGELDLVALELAGHGHSDHRPHGTHYYFSDYVFDVDAALEALACGTPVIASPQSGGIGDVAASATKGAVLVSELGDAFIEAMRQVRADPAKGLRPSLMPRKFELNHAIVEFERILVGGI